MFLLKKIKSLRRKKSVNMFILGHKVFFVTQKNYLFFCHKKTLFFSFQFFVTKIKHLIFLSLKISGDKNFR